MKADLWSAGGGFCAVVAIIDISFNRLKGVTIQALPLHHFSAQSTLLDAPQ
ncbi:hypothetical protein J4G02_18735 [Candidatus Poribacteria bacterium]|nr:hypothetical protein [Candidatus Poribacteria bacterium]